MVTNAIVRPPGPNFADGLTTANLGRPDYAKALEQHAEYCRALEACGLTLLRLQPDLRHPDSTFVEDTAILRPQRVILTNPGAESRRGEVDAMRQPLSHFFRSFVRIEPPGTVEAGDVCEAGERVFIGISARTNAEGARQLSEYVREEGCIPIVVDIRSIPGLLHLKSGISYLGDGRLAAIGALIRHEAIRSYATTHVSVGEEYAANCVRINDYLLMPLGYPRLETDLRDLGYHVLTLDMSEFRKMDGGLSCLSLRF